MTDNMIELKKDSLRQMQSGDIKLGFTIQHNDMPDYLFSDPMGKRYYVVFIDADHYDETEGKCDSQNHNETAEITPDKTCPIPTNDVRIEKQPSINEKSEGDRIRVRAIMLCKEKAFQEYRERFDARPRCHTHNDDHGGEWTTDMTGEEAAKGFILDKCNIKSRSELTTDKEAQRLFKQLDQKYKDWQFEQRHADNLNYAESINM